MRIEIFTVAFLLLTAGCDHPEQKPASEAPMPVRVLPVTAGSYHSSYEAVAQVKPFRTVELVARVSGFLQERPFREGSFVKKGDLLYLIEPAQYRIAQENAQAQLDMMKARRDNAAAEFGRIRQLYSEKIASPDRFDSAKAAKLEAEAAVQAAEAELKQAELNCSYTRITAPFDGWIGLTSRDVGNYLQAPSGTLATLAQVDPVRVEFSVSDAFALPKLTAELQQGRAPELIVRVLQRDGTLYPEAGKISFWENRMDSETASIRLQARFSNADRQLIPGEFVRVRLEEPAAEPVALVDPAALHYNQTRTFVYVVGPDSRLAVRPVELGAQLGNLFIAKSGLKPGDRTVAAGNPLLRPGAPVRILEENAR